jgi:hypothetical protein
MPNPIYLLNGNKKTLPTAPPKPTEERLVLGTISKIDGEDIFALVASYSPTYNYGPLRCTEGLTPTLGEEVLIGFDDQKNPWLVAASCKNVA